MNLEEEYTRICSRPLDREGVINGDIYEHLLRLRELAGECGNATEFGVRSSVSTVPLLLGCGDVRSYDIADNKPRFAQVAEAAKAEGKKWIFHKESTLEAVIEPTDLLFIDTLHTYGQLLAELERHAAKVAKKIVLHDTVSFGERGEDGRSPGLNGAVDAFLRNHPEWTKSDVRTNNNGLTTLSRVTP
jgi:hypothetical protein